MERQTFALVATDSHGRQFENFDLPYPNAYQTTPIIKRGYKIHQLEKEVYDAIKDIHTDDTVLIFLAAGINDCPIEYLMRVGESSQ